MVGRSPLAVKMAASASGKHQRVDRRCSCSPCRPGRPAALIEFCEICGILTRRYQDCQTGSDDKSVNVRIWDAWTGKQLSQLDGHIGSVNSVAFSPDDGSKIVCGSADTSIRIWDATIGKQLSRLDGHADSILFVAYSPDVSKIVSGSKDKSIRIWLGCVDGEKAKVSEGVRPDRLGHVCGIFTRRQQDCRQWQL